MASEDGGGEGQYPGVNSLVVQRQLNLGWIWVALYSIAGALALAHLLSSELLHVDHLYSLGAGGFVGAALVSRFSDGRGLRECMIASVLVVLGLSVLMSLPFLRDKVQMQTTYSELLSALAVMGASAVGGSRMGALWSDRVVYQGSTPMGAVMAAIVLVGAFACHVGLIAVFEEVSHRLAVFLVILSVVMTPAFAGAALQLGQAEPVERQMGYGLALIFGVFLVLIGWELHSLGGVLLLSLAFLGIGATIYSVSLPGMLTVRSSRFWDHRCNDVPVAVAVIAKDPQ